MAEYGDGDSYPQNTSVSVTDTSPPNRRSKEVKRWQEKVLMADRVYKQWETQWKCDELVEWYYGDQTPDEMLTGNTSEDPYVINKIFPTVEVKIPSLYFYNPKASVTPRPSRADDVGSASDIRALLREDTLNTIISDPKMRWKAHSNLALKEAFFRFGILEVGYSADSIDNPNADKPLYKDDGETPFMHEGKPLMQAQRIVEHEEVYVRRIPAKTFRVSVRAEPILENCDWCGYYEWIYLDDLKANPRLKNTKYLRGGAKLKAAYGGQAESDRDRSDDPNSPAKDGMVKVWKIWDIRAHKRMMFADGINKYLLEPEDFDFLPFFDLKFHEMLEGYYPAPPVFQWLHPQAEVNENRQMKRIHRRRFLRKYEALKGSIDQVEMDKLKNGVDGEIIWVNVNGALIPIQDAPLDASIWRGGDEANADFREAAVSGGEQVGVSDSDTATQAAIIEGRSKVREDFGRDLVGTWLSRGLFLLLKTIETYAVLPWWIKRNVDTIAPGAEQEALRVTQLWQEITAEELGDLTFDVTVDIEALSPQTEETKRTNWNQILGIITNTTLMSLLMNSDVLLKKTFGFYGVRSDKEISEIRQALILASQAAMQAEMMMKGLAAPGAAGGGSGGGPDPSSSAASVPPALGAPGPPPGAEAMNTQMSGQMGVQQ